MTKIKFALLALFFSQLLLVQAQYKNYDRAKTILITPTQYKVEYSFSPENLNNQFTESVNKLFYFSVAPNQTIQTSINETRFFEKFSQSKKINLPPEELSAWRSNSSNISEINLKVKGYIWWRGFYLAVIELTSPTNIEFIKFSITINSSEAKNNYPIQKNYNLSKEEKDFILNFESATPYLQNVRLPDWFYENHPYYKIGIAKDGVYRINLAQLSGNPNFPQNVNPKTFQLFQNGVEVPIFVHGESDNSFDANDYIEFPAQIPYTLKHRNINYNEPYNEFLNRYSDTSWYWITWGKSIGSRIESVNQNLQTTDTLFSFTETLHIEENNYIQILGDIIPKQSHYWTARKFPIWSFLSANQTITLPVTLNNFKGNDSIKIFAKVGSFGAESVSPAHKISLSLDNFSPSDTLKLERYNVGLLSAAYANQNISGTSHQLKLTSYPTNSKIVNDLVYDWFEVEYPREIKVYGDSLIFGFKNISDIKPKIIFITGLPDTNFIIYQISPKIKKIGNYQFIQNQFEWNLIFSDTISSVSKYYLWKNTKTLTPKIQYKQFFASLSSDKSQTDFIILTHKKFKPEVDAYKQYLISEKNISTRIIDVDDIYDEFNFGYTDPEAIKNFLKTSISWTLPAPKFLFLIGDASYDYKFVYKNFNAINYVPSIGFPVSDVAYSIWDSISMLQQFSVGRLPVNNVGEVSQYLQIRKNYDNYPNTEWNKRALFFSSGNPEVSGQLETFKSINNEVIEKYLSPPPLSAKGIHFYKTTNPYSDLGNYSGEFIKNEIAKGGTFISYIGHSGTQTWDNGIGDPVQLQNSVNRFALITDFGCSTAKFAEPQVKSFSELFLFGNSPSAISYIGNATLGFVSIATTYPQMFYETLLLDSNLTIGQAHAKSKNRYLNRFGNGAISQILLYSNSLIGDPSVELAIPRKPNLQLENKSIILPSSGFDDRTDSIKIKIAINNFGIFKNDSVSLSFLHKYKNNTIKSFSSKIRIPYFCDTLEFYLSTKKLSGTHTLVVSVDEENKISEISENDNSITVNFTVVTSDFLIAQPLSGNLSFVNEVIFLNPLRDTLQNIEAQISIDSNFTIPIIPVLIKTGATTKFSTSSLSKNKHYWWKIREVGKDWSTGTFYLGSENKSYTGATDSIEFTKGNLNNIIFTKNGVTISTKTFSLKVISAGNLDGSFGVLEINGKNIIQNSYFRGFTVVTIDTTNFEPISQKIFDTYEYSSHSDSLASFINSIPNGTLTIALTADEATRNLNNSARSAIARIGAAKINELGFFDSYLIIGKKGSPIGASIEKLVKSGSGKAIADTNYFVKQKIGNYTSPLFTNLKKIDTLSFLSEKPTGAKIIFNLISLKSSFRSSNQNSFQLDTLISDSTSNQINLSKIDLNKYDGIYFNFNLVSNENSVPPILNSWKVGTTYLADVILINSGIQLSKKIIPEGEVVTLSAKFEQLGQSNSDSMNVLLSTNDIGNDRILTNLKIPSIKKDSFATVSYNYDSNKKRGNHTFKFTIDSENKIRELFEINNTASYSYSVIADTIKPSMEITFDDEKKISGDYVSTNPTIILKIKDNNPYQITQKDTSLCKVYLNFQKPNFDNKILSFIPRNSDVKAEIIWKPTLIEGENYFDFISTDAVGNNSDTITLKLNVTLEASIIDCYTFPNPFQNSTTFTFQLASPNISDNLFINIYTVAGRLIEQIEIPSTELKVGFNKIDWDGRDRDGDEIANGVYLYKIVTSNNDKSISAIQKLVKIK